MKKFSIKFWIEKVQSMALRFSFTLFFVLGLAFLFFLKINSKNIEIQPHTWVFFSFGIAVSIAITLLSEELSKKTYKIAPNTGGILLLMLYCYFLPEKFEAVDFFQSIALCLSFILTAFIASFFRKNSDIPFWEFSKNVVIQIITSFIFSGVFMIGLSLAVLSLKELFNIDIQQKVYSNLAVVCFGIFGPVYFLSNVPDVAEKQKQEFKFDKFLKILGLYILFPILALYTLILYVYLAQIMVKWELPNGWLATLVSVLGLGGFVTMFILYPLRHDDSNKWLGWFYRFFPLILLPLLVLMFIGIYRRFSDYGITINRFYVLTLNVWLVCISIYLFLSKSKHLKWVVISFATILFFSSIGPWSAYKTTKNVLTNELKSSFEKTEWLKDGKIVLKSGLDLKIDSVSERKMAETIRYMVDNYGNKSIQQFFSTPLDKKLAGDILKDLNLKDEYRPEQEYFSAYLPTGFLLDIKDYDYMLDISMEKNKSTIYKDEKLSLTFENNEITLKFNDTKDKSIVIPLAGKLTELQSLGNKNKELNKDEMSVDGENYKLVIYNISAQKNRQDSVYKINDFNAHLYYKKP